MNKKDKKLVENNKVVVITGASKGIGLATANYFSENGYKVIGISRRTVKTDLFESLSCDVCDYENMKILFNQIEEKYGRIDIVINNAGFGISGAIEYATQKDIDLIFDVNVKAVIKTCQIAIPYLRKTKGKIINISSVASPIAIPFQACYSATKSAVETFSLALANEVKSQGIKISCVRPGDTKTSFTENRIKNEETNDVYKDKILKSVQKMEKDEQNGVSPIKVAKEIFKVATKKNPPLISTVGFSYKLVCFLERILPKKFVNFIIYKLY